MPPTPGPDPTAARVPYLDGLRGIAILLVIALHFLHLPFNPARHPNSWFVPVHHLLAAGWVGVDLFFVLSGYLLGGILLDHRDAPNLLPVFYLRRSCRILPAYWLFLAPLLVLPALGFTDRIQGLSALLTTGPIPHWVYPVFLQNVAMTVLGSWGEAWISTTWSLAVEEQFYLILPAIILLTPRSRLPAVLVVMTLLAPALRAALPLWLPQTHAEVGAYTLLPCRWDSLLLGVLTAWLIRDPTARAWLRGHAGFLRLTGLGLAVVAGVLMLDSPELNSRPMDTVGYSVFALLFSATVLCAELDLLPGRSLLEWRPLRWVGRVSYMLYLVHATVCSLLFHLVTHHARTLDNARDVALMTAGFAASLLVAGLSWRFFEQPILRFARRFSYRPAAARSNSSATG